MGIGTAVQKTGRLAVVWVLLGTVDGAAQSPVAEPTPQATITGIVTLQSGEERRRPPRYYRGPYRSARDTATAETPIQHVVIYLDDIATPAGGWPKAEEEKMAQRHDTFIPHVLPILAGTSVLFPNRDDYYHNVFSVVAGDRFDLGRYSAGNDQKQRFDAPAIVVVRCEIHAGMKAYIVVRDNPYFTKAQADGSYRLSVPAGTHRLVGWHPTRGRVDRQVHVAAGDSVRVDLDL